MFICMYLCNWKYYFTDYCCNKHLALKPNKFKKKIKNRISKEQITANLCEVKVDNRLLTEVRIATHNDTKLRREAKILKIAKIEIYAYYCTFKYDFIQR